MALIVLIGLILLLTAVVLLGPRVPVDTTIRPITLPENLEAYLEESESARPDIIPGAEKTIIWAHPDQHRTPVSIVYLHGFSACRQETVPLSDNLARALGANLFYTRLTGHGRGAAAMAEASINDWLNDAVEALEIGKRIGDRVIVLSVSTGSTLATWLALNGDQGKVLCHVMLSPNFALKDRRSEYVTRQWGTLLVRLMVGKTYQTIGLNEKHTRYWTQDYPSSSLAVLATLVRYVRELPLEQMTIPVLMFYSVHDQVIDAGEVERSFRRIGSARKELFPIEEWNETGNHVLAGDILAPENTERIQKVITEFVESLR